MDVCYTAYIRRTMSFVSTARNGMFLAPFIGKPYVFTTSLPADECLQRLRSHVSPTSRLWFRNGWNATTYNSSIFRKVVNTQFQLMKFPGASRLGVWIFSGEIIERDGVTHITGQYRPTTSAYFGWYVNLIFALGWSLAASVFFFQQQVQSNPSLPPTYRVVLLLLTLIGLGIIPIYWYVNRGEQNNEQDIIMFIKQVFQASI